jgi:hypothetical protein
MGVYKRLAQVPDRYRLSRYTDTYERRDIWAEYVDEAIPDDRGKRFMDDTERIERRWKAHMESRGRHHALATPADVEQWCVWLVTEFSIGHAYEPYWCRVEKFYEYLYWHTDHPHVYNPFFMAAAEHPAAGQIWEEKTSSLKWVAEDE